MKINRKLQADILHALEEVYPDRAYMANLFYLQEHGLIEGGDIREPGLCRSMIDVQITHAGLDFLADDGGLKAILGVQRINFQSYELIEVMKRIIQDSNLPHDELNALLHKVEKSDPLVLKEIVLGLLGSSGPDKLKIIQHLTVTVN